MSTFSLLMSFVSIFLLIVFTILGVISIIKKSSKVKRNFTYAGISIISTIVFFVIFGVSSDDIESSTSESSQELVDEEVTNTADANEDINNEEESVEEEVQTPQQEMFNKISELIDSKKAFDTGSYIKGEIPKGEYAFISFDGSGKYYSETDAAGNIIDNENFDSFGYVFVHGVGNIETEGALINISAINSLGVGSAKEIYQILNGVEDYKDSAWYKIGTDLQPGQYVIESYGEGYVAVMAGPVGKSDIIDNENFNGKHMVTVSKGQYLQVSGGTISQ
ncbi:hypothetical protein WKH31_08215 [Metabacillus indicus]|uniref:hypothetical protein n=1 Tax=Metabacillus indicus TaxID=246786 RepID=UPI003174399F